MKKKIGLLLMVLFNMAFAGNTTISALPDQMQQALTKMLNGLTNGIAVFAVIVAIIISGFTLAFVDIGAGWKKFVGTIFAGSIILGATSIVSFVFGSCF